jgi:hypothetical protein
VRPRAEARRDPREGIVGYSEIGLKRASGLDADLRTVRDLHPRLEARYTTRWRGIVSERVSLVAKTDVRSVQLHRRGFGGNGI